MAANRALQPRSSVWLTSRSPRGRRGTDSGTGAGNLDRAKIVTAAVRMLDAEGTDRFSMRRLAAELGVTPMSLYWYVDNKDDLMELALDAVAGEIELPDLDADPDADLDWRTHLRTLASAWRRTMIGHPWAIRCYGEYLNIGPASMRFARCAQAVVERAPLPEEERPTALSAVFQYVYGFTAMESRWQEYGRESGRSPDEFFAEVAGSVARAPDVDATGGVLERHAGLTMQQMRDLDFDRTLGWLIAGMCVGRQP